MHAIRILAARNAAKLWVGTVRVEGRDIVVSARSLGEFEEDAGGQIAAAAGGVPEDLDLTVEADLDPVVRLHAAEARAHAAELSTAADQARVSTQRAAIALRGAGLSQRDVAYVLGVHRTRISDIENGLHSAG